MEVLSVVNRKHLAWSSSVFQVLSSTLVFLLLYKSLYTAVGPERVGVWALLLAFMSIFRVVEVGFSAATSKYVAKYNALNDLSKVASVIHTLLLNTIGSVVTLLLLLMPWYDSIVSFVVPDTYITEGRNVVPWLVASIFMGSIAGILEATIFGLGRIVARNLMVIFSGWCMLCVALLLLPEYGLQGVAIALTVQSLLLLFLCSIYIIFGKTDVHIFTQKWSLYHCNESLSFVFSSQVISILFLLFDPLVKTIIGNVGGMASLGYFDMARQCVVKVRSLLLSAVRVLEPKIIDCAERNPAQIVAMFTLYNTLNMKFSIFIFGGLLLSIPWVSLLWLGIFSWEFYWMATLLALGWFINTAGVIAYVFNTALGELKWNFLSHLLMLILSGALALAMGSLWGVYASVVGVSLAIALSGLLVLVTFFKRHNIPLSRLNGNLSANR